MTQSGLVRDQDRSDIEETAVTGGHLLQAGDLAARNAFKAQIGRLERECSAIVAGAFPHLSPAELPDATGAAIGGPCLPTLEVLEWTRDRLAGRVRDMRGLQLSVQNTSAPHASCSRG